MICALPVRFAAEMFARSFVLLTKVVASAVLFQNTFDVLTNPLPRIVRTVVGEPAITEAGAIEAISGDAVTTAGCAREAPQWLPKSNIPQKTNKSE
jgi:hypothetical protein